MRLVPGAHGDMRLVWLWISPCKLIRLFTLNFGSQGYALVPWLLTPFVRPVTRQEGSHNEHHMHTCAVVECTIGVLEARWMCLHTAGTRLLYSPEKTCQVILVIILCDERVQVTIKGSYILVTFSFCKISPWTTVSHHLIQTRRHPPTPPPFYCFLVNQRAAIWSLITHFRYLSATEYKQTFFPAIARMIAGPEITLHKAVTT